jgi:hypothetical protein
MRVRIYSHQLEKKKSFIELTCSLEVIQEKDFIPGLCISGMYKIKARHIVI